MDLGNMRESKNVADHSNYLTKLAPNQDNPDFYYFWRQMHENPNDSSYLPKQTNPENAGPPKPLIPYHELSEEEKSLVQDYGFNDKDILLMRKFNTSPGQVMDGWNLQPNR